MLNHAIDNLTTAQEDAYLTTGLRAFYRNDSGGRRCHLGMLDLAKAGAAYGGEQYYCGDGDRLLAARFNALCVKLQGKRVTWSSSPWAEYAENKNLQVEYTECDQGAARLGDLIRNRILTNRARRTLTAAPLVEATT